MVPRHAMPCSSHISIIPRFVALSVDALGLEFRARRARRPVIVTLDPASAAGLASLCSALPRIRGAATTIMCRVAPFPRIGTLACLHDGMAWVSKKIDDWFRLDFPIKWNTWFSLWVVQVQNGDPAECRKLCVLMDSNIGANGYTTAPITYQGRKAPHVLLKSSSRWASF